VDDALGTELRIWRLQASVLELSGSQAQHAQHTHSGDNESFHFGIVFLTVYALALSYVFSIFFFGSRRAFFYRPIGWH